MLSLTVVEQFYVTHGVYVDFALYCAFFVAVAVHGLSRFMPGRQGKIVAVVLGIVLAAALLEVQRTQGFTIASLGPLAVFVVLVLFVGAAYHTCRRFQLDAVPAAAVAALAGLLLLYAGQVEAIAAALLPLLEILLFVLLLVLLVTHGSPLVQPPEAAMAEHDELSAALDEQRALVLGCLLEVKRLRAEALSGKKSSAPQFGMVARRLRALEQALLDATQRMHWLLCRRGATSEETRHFRQRLREYEKVVRQAASIACSHILLAERRMRTGDFDDALLLVDKAKQHLHGLAVLEKEVRGMVEGRG